MLNDVKSSSGLFKQRGPAALRRLFHSRNRDAVMIDCIGNSAYLADPEVYKLVMHIQTAIAIPLHIYGVYCILFRTPKRMSSIVSCNLRPAFGDRKLVIMTLDPLPITICLAILAVNFTLQVFFMFFLVFVKVMQRDQKLSRMSRKTHDLQKKFAIALTIQTFIPFTLIIIPITYVVFAMTTGYLNQSFNNAAICTLASHGFFSTLAMILVHQPYRDATFSWIPKNIFKPMKTHCEGEVTAVVCSPTLRIKKPSPMIDCIGNSAYLADPEVYKLVMHIQTAIAIPLHIYGVFCILFKTPKRMSSVKWIFLMLHGFSFMDRKLIVLAVERQPISICLAILAVAFTFQILFIFFLVSAKVMQRDRKLSRMSRKTHYLQKKFTIALTIQTFLPFTLIIIPASYIVLAMITGWLNQSLSNAACCIIASHGFFSTIAMILVHQPYRDATINPLYPMIDCIGNSAYLADPEVYKLVMHIQTAIAIPLHIYGVYCILFKTTKRMSSVKWIFLMLHGFSVLSDVTFSLLFLPFIIFPLTIGYPLGIWDHPLLECYMIVTLISLTGFSILVVTENRYHVLFGNPFWQKTRKTYLFLNFLLAITGFIPPFYYTPEQTFSDQTLNEISKIVSCTLRPAFEDRKLVILGVDPLPITICLAILAVNFTFQVLFMFFLVFVKVIQRDRNLPMMSRKTHDLQKKFAIALTIQTFIPFTLIIIPITYVVLAMIFGLLNQSFNNAAICTLASHGFFSTIAMILVHQPYRDATFFWIPLLLKSMKTNRTVLGRVFSDPDVFKLVLHIQTCIELPLHMYGVYCILAKTPSRMRSVKWIFLMLHGFSVLCDVTISVVFIPFVFFPMTIGYALGAWDYPAIECYGIVTIVCSITGFVPPLFFTPDRDVDIGELSKALSCALQPTYRDRNLYVMAVESDLIMICMAYLTVSYTVQVLSFFFLIFTRIIRRDKKMNVVSQRTHTLQKKFAIALTIQTFVPFTLIIIPITYIVVSMIIQYFNQTLNNLIVCVIASHGFFSTLTMILVHRPYRDATFSWIPSIMKSARTPSCAVTNQYF
ncbi:unnamed protein product [Caenorhabditis sp. 36 PRJEB53466]|nr:unnamed protein product [Caenorhabditis sp. 36 PRJEB53466]